MIELSDEVLCAYLDNELDAVQRAQVQAALEADAGARVRLDRMRAADQLLHQALPVESAGRQDPLVQLIRGESTQSATTKVVSLVRPVRTYWWAMAASVAGLAIGVLLATQLGSSKLDSLSVAGMSVFDANLNALMRDALNQAGSGSQLQRDGAQVQMVLSFKANDGRVCRVLNAGNATQQLDAVACRTQDQWQLVALDASVAKSGQYQAAGASEMVDAVMSRLGANAALEADAEQALLQRGWH